MKKTVTIISIICVVIIAAGVLLLTGVIDVKALVSKLHGGTNIQAETMSQTSGAADTAADPETPYAMQTSAAVWISYMDTCVLIDKNGMTVGTTETQPGNTMKLSGVEITRMVIGEPVEVNDREAFDYGLLVTNKLAAVGIDDKGEVFISADGSAILYIRNIKILLGKNDDLLEKLEALRKFYNKVVDLDGTLDMQELDRNNMGYTFKVNGAESGNTGEDGLETEIMDENGDEEEKPEDAEAEDGEEYTEEEPEEDAEDDE